MGMFEEHKQALKQIRKEVDEDMEEQAKRIREDEILI
jgi:ribosome recycling factor